MAQTMVNFRMDEELKKTRLYLFNPGSRKHAGRCIQWICQSWIHEYDELEEDWCVKFQDQEQYWIVDIRIYTDIKPLVQKFTFLSVILYNNYFKMFY